MARCKQSSTRPPNCNFLCLILVTERKKYIYSTNIFLYIFFLHSSPFYFFEKVLKRIPSFSSYPFLSFSIFGEIGCFEGLEEIELSSLEKNFDFSSRSFNCFFAIKIFKLFKLFQNYLYSSANANLLLSFVLFNFLSFPSIHLLQKIYYDSIIHPGDIKLDGIFENNQSSRQVSPNSNNFRPTIIISLASNLFPVNTVDIGRYLMNIKWRV